MYIFGGYEEAAEPFRPDVYKLDLNLFEWTLLKCKGEPPLYRDFHTATAIGDKMFIFGGRSDKTANGNNDHHHFNHFPGLIAGHEYYSDKLVYLVSIPDIYLTIEENFDEFQNIGDHTKIGNQDDLYSSNQQLSQQNTPLSTFDDQTEKHNGVVHSHIKDRDTQEAGK